MATSKFDTGVQLCSCNNCGTILIDKNPQSDAKRYEVNFNKVVELEFINAEDDMTDPLKKDSEIDGNEYFWGCPICQTDGYLNDEINEDDARKLGIIA